MNSPSESPTPTTATEAETLTDPKADIVNLKVALECDVCKKNVAKGVASSCFGAISLAYCVECLTEQAEAEFIFEYLYSDVSDHGEGLIPMDAWKTYKNDAYMTWADWLEWRKTQPDRPPPPDLTQEQIDSMDAEASSLI